MMGFIDAIKLGFVRYVAFTTRLSRSEYWWWILFVLFADVIVVIVGSLLFGPSIERSDTGIARQVYDGGVLAVIFYAAILVPTIAVSCRRLHDIDKSGWWLLLVFIPIIGSFILLYWFVIRGDDGDNRFGADPLAGVV